MLRVRKKERFRPQIDRKSTKYPTLPSSHVLLLLRMLLFSPFCLFFYNYEQFLQFLLVSLFLQKKRASNFSPLLHHITSHYKEKATKTICLLPGGKKWRPQSTRTLRRRTRSSRRLNRRLKRGGKRKMMMMMMRRRSHQEGGILLLMMMIVMTTWK